MELKDKLKHEGWRKLKSLLKRFIYITMPGLCLYTSDKHPNTFMVLEKLNIFSFKFDTRCTRGSDTFELLMSFWSCLTIHPIDFKSFIPYRIFPLYLPCPYIINLLIFLQRWLMWWHSLLPTEVVISQAQALKLQVYQMHVQCQ